MNESAYPAASSSTGPAAGAGPDRTWAIAAHVGGLLTTWLVPLFIYLVKKSDPQAAFASAQAREALNFQITVCIAYLVCMLLSLVLIGLLLFWLVLLANLALSVIAAVKSSNGHAYRYPLTLRLVR